MNKAASYLMIVGGYVLLSTSYGQDQQTGEPTNSHDGGFLTIGIGLSLDDSPYNNDASDAETSLFLNGRYQYNGFFIEYPGVSLSHQSTILSLGYNFHNSEHWRYDIQLAMNHADVVFSDAQAALLGEKKRASHSKFGLRASGEYGQNFYQLVLAGASDDEGTFSLNNNGVYFGAFQRRYFRLGNWHVHAGLGAQYRSSDSVNHFFGISEAQASEQFRPYAGRAGFELSAQLGVEYALAEDWLLESYLRVTDLPSGISNSPLVDKDYHLIGAFALSYVF